MYVVKFYNSDGSYERRSSVSSFGECLHVQSHDSNHRSNIFEIRFDLEGNIFDQEYLSQIKNEVKHV